MPTDTTDIRTWCDERLADPAEDLYHAVLFAPPRLRAGVRAVASMYIELEAIATGFRDLHVARTKLAWWRDELERLHAGQAAHPVTRMLAGATATPEDLSLPDLVTGMELILLEGPVTDLATARMRAERGMSRFAVVLARLLDDTARAEAYAPLGTATGLARTLGSARLEDTARGEIGAAARRMLNEQARTALAAPSPLRVLAALAWRATSRTDRSARRRRTDARRVFAAWRAARGRLPRTMLRTAQRRD